MTATSKPTVIRLRPNPNARLRLFCFPYAGGGAFAFRSWANYLSPEIEVCAIQLPGRENRLKEKLFSDISALIGALTETLFPYCLSRPFAFFGHSLGALLSFELAVQLRSQYGIAPAHMIVSARLAPQVKDPEPPIHQLPDNLLTEQLRRLDGTPESVLANHELMSLLLPTLRADLAIDERYVYVPSEPLDAPISAYGGLNDDRVSRDDLMQWAVQTRVRFNLVMFPGCHFFIRTSEALVLQTVIQELRQQQR